MGEEASAIAQADLDMAHSKDEGLFVQHFSRMI